MENKNEIEILHKKLDLLLDKQQGFSKEIDQLRVEISRLPYAQPCAAPKPTSESKVDIPNPIPPKEKEEYVELVERKPDPRDEKILDVPPISKKVKTRGYGDTNISELDLEKFIGENLISKIGIFITIIGVAIGAKYSIENELISPLTRIILGYLMGVGLLGFGMKLKTDYKNFSAVLVSGSIAILYFITFAGYSFYGLFPQLFAFGLMTLLTIFTVVAAIHYDKPIIAHIGLVGAYGVPFLLSTESGNVTALFTYIAIINLGILLIAFKKYWKSLYYSASGLTWLIYATWYFMDYKTLEHFTIALVFLSVFFAIFYAAFLAYKITQAEKIEITEILLILLNAFIFYGIGYSILENHETGEQLLGLFTLGNGLIHFIVSAFIYQKKLGDQKLLYLISGLVLVFITAAIPVQLDGNYVTILWALEAAVVFWIGRSKGFSIYEEIAYPVMALALGSLLEDWSLAYPGFVENNTKMITPLLNIHFLSSLLFIGAFAFIQFINQNKNYVSAFEKDKSLQKFISYTIPAILLFIIYASFRNEIAHYWNQLFATPAIGLTGEENDYRRTTWNYDLILFRDIWVINYSICFLVILSYFNLLKLKNKQFGYLNLTLNGLALFAFLALGLYNLSELRESYLEQGPDEVFVIGRFNLSIRYVSYIFVGVLLYTFYQYRIKMFPEKRFKMGFDILLYSSILWIASSELIHWIDVSGASEKSYKLALSIFWGTYALTLVCIGIWKRKKHLRIGAMILFGGTLMKLFFYDLANLNTISKTIVLVSLGILLLIISFLYNKFTLKISDEDEA
jgi:uncharacterized membrane protein